MTFVRNSSLYFTGFAKALVTQNGMDKVTIEHFCGHVSQN